MDRESLYRKIRELREQLTIQPSEEDPSVWADRVNACLAEIEAGLPFQSLPFEQIFQELPTATLLTDSAGTIIAANRAMQNLCGQNPAQLTGIPMSTLFRPHDWPQIGRCLEAVLSGKVSQAWEGHLEREGRPALIEVQAAALPGSVPELIHWNLRDPVRRKRAEQALQERENLLQAVVNQAGLFFYNLDHNGIIRQFFGRNISGIPGPVEIVGSSIFDFYTEAPGLQASFERALAKDSFSTLIEIKGLLIETFNVPQLDEQGNVIGLIGIGLDVTGRERVESALEQSEARFRVLFDEADIGIVLLDLAGRPLEANSSFHQMIGYNPNELREMTLLDWVYAEDQDPVHKILQAMVDGQNHEDRAKMDLRYQRKDGSLLWVRQSLSLPRDIRRQPQFLLCLAENINPQKQAEIELVEIQHRLLDGIEAERINLARELHDGPIQDLYGALFYLDEIREMLSPEQEPEVLDAGVVDQVKEVLSTAISSLRAITGELRPPSLSRFGLEKAIRAHIAQVQEQFPETSFALDLDNDGEDLPEQVRLAFFRVYQQSVMNVIRHAEAKHVWVSFELDEAGAWLEIRDDGRGFQAPKRWVELARQGHYGLVGAAERTHAIGGEFSVESQPGGGTRVFMRVPAFWNNRTSSG